MDGMKRTKLRERLLPPYSFREEMVNMISHAAGGVFAIVALCTCVCMAAIKGNTWGVAASAIYGAAMIMLYTMSSLYHGLTAPVPKRVFQIIDHCSVFLLIAGTYTPFTLVSLRPAYPLKAWIIFGVVWGFTILGVVLNSIDLKKFKIFSMICYLCTGWSIVSVAPSLIDTLSTPGFVLLILGGAAYTIGAILYGVGKKIPYMHSAFHFLVLIGSILHYISILVYVLPM